MSQPGAPQSKLPPGLDALIRRIQDLERNLTELSGVVGQRLASGVDLQQQLDVTQAGLATAQTAIAALGVLPLVAYGASPTSSNGTSGPNQIAAAGFAVPAGYTRALIFAHAFAGASCVVGGGAYINVVCRINSPAGNKDSAGVNQWVTAGTGGTASASNAALLTGLSGGDAMFVAVVTLESPAANIAPGTVGGAVSAMAIFLK